MNFALNLVLSCLWYMLPAYFANMTPVFVMGHFEFLAKPIDFNKKINGKSIFGAHKTFRGLIFGILISIIITVLQVFLYSNSSFFRAISLVNYSGINYILLGFLLGFGALLGDIVKSFFKRQLKIKPGTRWVPFDQLDYVIGALLLSSIVYIPKLTAIILIVLLSFSLHIIANHIGYYISIKETKW